MQAAVRGQEDRQAALGALEPQARMQPEAALSTVADSADEGGCGTGGVPGRDAALHVVNRSRSDGLCKRGSHAIQLVRCQGAPLPGQLELSSRRRLIKLQEIGRELPNRLQV